MVFCEFFPTTSALQRRAVGKDHCAAQSVLVRVRTLWLRSGQTTQAWVWRLPLWWIFATLILLSVLRAFWLTTGET
jgi:hypothetical protein